MNSRNLAPRLSHLSAVGPRTAQRGESYPNVPGPREGVETEQTSRFSRTVTGKCPHMGKGRTQY
ncbi:hypothetical protein GCM10017687_06110 [Streptomyces echinatus]